MPGPSLLAPLLRRGPREPDLVLVNARTGGVLASELELARDSRSRRIGLLGRTTFTDGQALIIAPSNAVHTFGMRFPIDLVFVTASGRVTRARAGLGAARVCMSPSAYAVVELPVGTIARSRTVRGDLLAICRRSAEG
jgi:uncharacterized membrane protein (UPF0127 family)